MYEYKPFLLGIKYGWDMESKGKSKWDDENILSGDIILYRCYEWVSLCGLLLWL